MKLKKVLALVTAVAICLQGIPVYAAGSENPTRKEITHTGKKGDWDDEEDTEDTSSYTPIYTIGDLAGINNNPDGKYILMNDIDMTEETREGGSWDTGHGWTPLKSFSGVLDGNGYRIIGMHIYGAFVESPVGLFSKIWDRGEIKNLGMIQVNIDDVTINRDWVGVGALTGHLEGKISNCYVTGNISANGTSCIGGLVGYLLTRAGKISISNSYNAAKVTGTGIVGNYLGSEVEYCYNIGEINNGYPITNDDKNDRSYFYSYPNYALQGKSLDSKSATMLTETQMRIQNMYVGFDFENVWEIDPNSNYPYPQLKSNRHQRVEGFDIVTPPTKTVYSQGEKIDLSGGTAKIIYEGNYSTTVVLTDDMLEAYDTMQTGMQEIFVQYGGRRVSFPITVSGISVQSIKITGEGNKLPKGNSMQLKASVEPANATDLVVTWSSSDSSIATVDEHGKVNALQAGSVVITATAANGMSAQYSIDITVPCVLLQLNQSQHTMYKGETLTLLSTLSPVDTTDTVSWKISNSQIATIDANGKVTGNAAGQVTVTASAGTATATCKITVKRKMEDFHIEGVIDKEYTGEEVEQKIQVTDGSTVLKQDTDYEISYTDNIEIGTASVQVTGKGYYEGSIRKNFKISNKVSTTNKPTQTNAPTASNAPNTSNTPTASNAPNTSNVANNTPTGTNAIIYTGESTSLPKLVDPIGAKTFKSWRSSNVNIATINDSGWITGNTIGEVKITAVLGNGASITYNVMVKQKIDNFYITGVYAKNYTGKEIKQTIEVTDGETILVDGEDYTVRYENNIEVGKAQIYVTGTGFYEGSIRASFTIKGKGSSVGKAEISKLKNVMGRKIKVSLKNITGVDGYEIRYSTKSNMKGSKNRNTTKTSLTVTSLKKKKRYYVQARAYCYSNSGKKVYGKWGAKKNIVIKK